MVKYKRVEESVRICLTHFSNEAIKTDEKTLNGVYGNGAKFSGPISEGVRWFNDAAFGHELFNYTAVIKKSFGKYNETSGFYDEDSCMYSMQKNESDASLVYVKMPVLAPGLRQVPPWIREYTAILSKYNVTNAVSIPDVFESFRTAFDTYIWVTLVLFTVAFIVLVKTQINLVNKRVKRQRYEYLKQKWQNLGLRANPNPKLASRLLNDPRARVMAPTPRPNQPNDLNLMQDNAIYDVLTHFFQVETADYSLGLLRLVVLLITLLSFYIFTYFGNLMSTEMVLDEEPSMIRSYKDLLDRGKVQIVFLEVQEDYKQFEFAPEGSVKRKLWDRSLESVKGKRSDLFITLGTSAGLASSAIGSISNTVNVDEKNRIELVAVFSSTIVVTARATACTLKAAFAYRHSKTDPQVAKVFKPVENVYSLVSKDPEERETMVAPAFREDWTAPLSNRIIKRAVNLVEVGTMEYILQKALANSALSTFTIQTPEEADVYRKCMTDEIADNMPTHTLIAMKLVQFKLLFLSCAGLLALAFIVLFYEKWVAG